MTNERKAAADTPAAYPTCEKPNTDFATPVDMDRQETPCFCGKTKAFVASGKKFECPDCKVENTSLIVICKKCGTKAHCFSGGIPTSERKFICNCPRIQGLSPITQ